MTANAGVGLAMSTQSVYGNNVINGNTGGNVTLGLDRGGNACGGTPGCP